jgi:HD-GYP domain-containing protein (c-di-GMP phosphodiesterase class II)
MKTYPLREFIQKVLLVRLAVATAAIALIVGFFSYFAAAGRLSEQVADLGRRGAAVLVDQVRYEMEQRPTGALVALRAVLGRSEPPLVYHAGRFVAVQVYDRTSSILAERSAEDERAVEGTKAFLSGHPFTFPGADGMETRQVHIGGALFVLVAVPIADKTGATAAYIRGLFAVSPAAIAEMHKSVARSVLLAVLIVVVVAALLYPVILHLMRKLSDYSTHLLDANLEVLHTLGCAIAKRDSDTDAHNYRVSLYSARIGEVAGLTHADMRTLIKGSFLHDVGKIGIPDKVLHKPGRLDEAEFAMMKAHVDMGRDIVERSTWLRDGGQVVEYHHEKFGGGGYPRGLAGSDIPVTARIFAIADVFDALTSERPYKKPLSFEETMDLLEQDRGSHFDPAMLDVFGGIARDLHGRYGGREGDELRDELEALIAQYYSAGEETLRY